jgi:hypothetical protein
MTQEFNEPVLGGAFARTTVGETFLKGAAAVGAAAEH